MINRFSLFVGTPKLAVEFIVPSTPATECACTKQPTDAAVICKNSPTTFINMTQLTLVGGLSLGLDVPFYSYPVDVRIQMADTNFDWVDITHSEVSIHFRKYLYYY